MSELLDFYQQQAEENLSSISWIAELQAKGWNELKTQGFPTRFNEDWKYTRVEELLQQRFPSVLDSKPLEVSKVCFDSPIPSQAILYNGEVRQEDTQHSSLPAGVLIVPLAQALLTHENLIKPYLDKLLTHEHGFHALNTALLNLGVLVYLPGGIHFEKPIVLSHYQDQTQSLQIRHLVILEDNAEATIVEDYHGDNNCQYFTNTVTEIYVGKQAKLNHYKVQRESKHAYHIGHVAVQQAAGSEFNSHVFSLGGKLSRSDINIHLQEEKAACLLNGIYIPTEQQHIDHHTVIHHLVPNCVSEQDYKGILNGRSRAVFNGKVIVARHAQNTQATQSNKNILLSADAEVDTKPQLEIFADNIRCSHGATVGHLDDEALFYLTSRGIPPDEAHRYLIHAFMTINLNFISHPILASWIKHLIDQQLG